MTLRTALYLLLGLLWSSLVFCLDQDSLGGSKPTFVTPEYILPCNRTDPKLEFCVMRTLNHLQPYLIKGIPDLELPPIEPLIIPELRMENGQGAVRVRAVFSNITAIGGGNYTLNKIRVDIDNYRVDLHISIPKIELRGRYEVIGNVLLFPIQSRGEFWALLGDVGAIAGIQGIEDVRDGVRYMKIVRMLVDFSLGRVRFRVVDELNGDNVIGQAMNQFLNQNVKEIIEEMRPAASASIAKHFKDFLNMALTKVPLDVWLPDT
ncbi:hypothetical protein KM043_017702 [Ampulex compressa]|nr:hypothetical protein KM043_017702 [Ampulex compressa]